MIGSAPAEGGAGVAWMSNSVAWASNSVAWASNSRGLSRVSR